MTAKALADFIDVSKYARYIPELKRRETPEEAGRRMFDMHRRRYPEATKYIDEAWEMFRDGKILGSQRALQFGGRAMELKHSRGYNCCASYCDRPRFFQEAFWLLLCGCGTGFSVQRHHVAQLPRLSRPKGNGSTRTFVVPDTIEGWADAAGELINSYLDPEATAVVFDTTLIRPKGSPLSTGGKAPGPRPLEKALRRVRRVLERCLDTGQERLRPIDCYDVTCHLSDAVLSGGIRRSSAICIFSADDEEMMRAKTDNWMDENPQRARSNNSALLLRGQTDRETFDHLIDCARQWGDPAPYWSDSTEFVANPCNEVGFLPKWEGKTGWGFCNLTTINTEACKTPHDFLRACRAATILGTLQAGYTDFSYLGEVSEAIARHEALLGVSMTGIMRNVDVVLRPDILRLGAQEVLRVNEEVAAVIGINPAARATCLKPEGTSSLKLQTSSGMTPDHARRYLRRVQVNRDEPPAAYFKFHNPQAVEPSVWSANDTDDSLIFCITAPSGALTKDDVGALQLLEWIKMVKENWVDEGKRPERCLHPSLSHNVSNTVHIAREEEWGQAADYIFEHQHTFAGVTLLAQGADLDFRQAPNTRVKTRDEILAEYGFIVSRNMVDDALRLFGDVWEACAAVERTEVLDQGRETWMANFMKMADIFFAGDRRRLGHHLKDIYLCGKWDELMARWSHVDYRLMIEEEDVVRFQAEPACAGGMCEI